MLFTCANDDFQSRKNAIFENYLKILSFEKIQMLDVFKMARPVCSRLHFYLISHFTKKKLSSKTLCFAFLTKKVVVKENFPKHH